MIINEFVSGVSGIPPILDNFKGTIINNGTLHTKKGINDSVEGAIYNTSGTITNNGTIINDGRITADGTIIFEGGSIINEPYWNGGA